jgi:hypothetical protein
LTTLTAAFTANPGLAVYSEGPRHFECIVGPVGGAALIDAAATVLGVGQHKDPGLRADAMMLPKIAAAYVEQGNLDGEEEPQGKDKGPRQVL